MTSFVIVVSAVFGSIMRTDTERETHTDAQTDADERYTPATLVDVT